MNKNYFKISGNIVDVVNRRIFKGEITVDGDRISSIISKAEAPDRYILPGFVDAHIHIESAMLVPSAFARIAVRHGTVATVSDPHEIANVLGVEGIDFMIENGKTVPFKFYFGAPSCVPATVFETNGHRISSDQINQLLQRDEIWFLSEMMNFPGVIYNDKDVCRKMELSRKFRKPIDGHAPGVSGKALVKYAGAGISTDHESTALDEALEKIRNGMKIQIREGSAAKNFDTLCTLVDTHTDRVMLCSDDLHPDDLVNGHINWLLKRGVASGLDVLNLLQAAAVNPVKHYQLPVGLLQANDPADFIVVSDLNAFDVLQTYINGELVYDNGNVLFECPEVIPVNNFNCEKISEQDIQVTSTGKTIRILDAFDGSLFTKAAMLPSTVKNGFLVSDTNRDILKIVVVNRYAKKAKPAVGFIRNFGLKKGAIAGSIAHDSHNVIALGVDDADIVNAINTVIENRGGMALSNDRECSALPLPVAGLMSAEKGEVVAEKYEQIDKKAKALGSQLRAPFMTLSFMALLVIPELKIGDQGLFDGNAFAPVSLFV